VHGLRILWRACLQLAIGVAGVALLPEHPVLWLPLGALAVAGYINVANFMDGINGISSLHAIVVGALYAFLGLVVGQSAVVVVSIVLAMAFMGFLPWNVRGRMFLGDSGSYLLGGTIGIVGVAAALAGAPIPAVVGPAAIYLADTGFTLVRRIVRGERWYESHRTHTYQQLTDRGLSHVSSSLCVAGFGLLTGAAGLISLLDGTLWVVLSAFLIIGFAGVYLAMPTLLARHGRAGIRTGPGESTGSGEFTGSENSQQTASDVRESARAPEREVSAGLRWAVVGGSGFVGQSIVASLRSIGADVISIPAPRLSIASSADTFHIIAAARQTAQEADLAQSLAGRDVVVNAAGVADPNAGESDVLVGANALLPAALALAASRSSARRFVHLSSAAVQGRAATLDESMELRPFSPYSRSKALGEEALIELQRSQLGAESLDVVIVRATSVQGAGRKTTEQLRRLARMPIASVASPGTQRSPITSDVALANLVREAGAYQGRVPRVVLQPWEGMTTRTVLQAAGGREPRVLPSWLCRVALRVAYAIGRVVRGRLNGSIRRVEMMWFGQEQCETWADRVGLSLPRAVSAILAEPTPRDRNREGELA
jgi:dTDP-4-dehydrorhamnose reductase